MRRIFLFAVLMAASFSLHAQGNNQSTRKAAQWVETLQSPEVSENGDVTFRYAAPRTRDVKLQCQAAPTTPMTWDETEGLWKVTIHPAVADIYPYNFVVDGVSVNDPNNKEIFPNELFKGSLLTMPNPDMLYTIRDVPHGKVQYCTYYSTVLKEFRTVLVYTPAGYDADVKRQYPVLYLVSGTTDTEETWYKAGRTNFIMDNLIADTRANKMIVVMPYGNMNTGNPRPSSPEATACYEIFSQEMQQCIMPFVEKNFRTQNDRDHRAIAGFSRGGGEALYTAFRLSDQFASVCSYSAYLTNEVYEQQFAHLVNNPAEMNKKYRFIWFGVGDSDILIEGVRQNEAFFKEKGINFEQFDTTGGHTWMNARKFLGITAQKLFKIHSKTVEEGGTGAYKAIVTDEETLPGFTVYRPQDMTAAVKAQGKLPILLFANGGCMNASVAYENMLNEIASQGYFVVAIGEIQQRQFDRNEVGTPSEMLDEALNWVLLQAKTKGMKYYGQLDVKNIAAAGHSCGGAQVLYNCGNKNIKTCLILNAGMGSMTMAGASPASLLNLHQPILYVTGGPSDVAYNNARIDFQSISKVPVFLADHPASGHGGTYGHPHGGPYAQLVLRWLDWQLKSKKANASIFMKPDLTDFPGWTIQKK